MRNVKTRKDKSAKGCMDTPVMIVGLNESGTGLTARPGKELWRNSYAPMYEDEWGPGPRSTPILDEDRVYVQSCKGEFRCLDREQGKAIWGASFEKDFGIHFVGSKANEGTASRRGN